MRSQHDIRCATCRRRASDWSCRRRSTNVGRPCLNIDVTLDVDGVVRWRIETSRTARNSMQNVPRPSGDVMTAILRVDENALDRWETVRVVIEVLSGSGTDLKSSVRNMRSATKRSVERRRRPRLDRNRGWLSEVARCGWRRRVFLLCLTELSSFSWRRHGRTRSGDLARWRRRSGTLMGWRWDWPDVAGCRRSLHLWCWTDIEPETVAMMVPVRARVELPWQWLRLSSVVVENCLLLSSAPGQSPVFGWCRLLVVWLVACLGVIGIVHCSRLRFPHRVPDDCSDRSLGWFVVKEVHPRRPRNGIATGRLIEDVNWLLSLTPPAAIFTNCPVNGLGDFSPPKCSFHRRWSFGERESRILHHNVTVPVVTLGN